MVANWFCALMLLVPLAAVGADIDETTLRERARGALARLDGEVLVPQLQEPVEVLRDRWGIPHIYARNTHDLFMAQGFVAAQDRLFQIDMWRRLARGETAEVLGPGALPRDRSARLLQYRGDMQQEWASYSPDARDIAKAFTDGINAYIEHARDTLPIEFQLLGFRPGHWKPEDCLGRTSLLPVALNLRQEIVRAELVATIGVERARLVMPADPPIPFAPAAGLDLSGIDSSLLADYRALTSPLDFAAPPAADASEGSNNWVVDGTLSATHKPLLASDPHRGIALPSLRYLVHLNAPGWNVIGSGEPGLPGVAIGHNERIAWGFTVVTTDQADVFVEETNPQNPRQYRVGDQWRDMVEIEESVLVKNADPATLVLRFTRHGPVIHEDRERHRAYVLHWVGSQPGTAAYVGSLAVDRAANWPQFLQAIESWKTPSENMIYADVDGNIGWVAAALTPRRDGWNGLLPVPGRDGRYRWRGFLGVQDLPQASNPARHWLATANHNILPDNYPHAISYDWAAGYRYRRLEQLLAAKERFTLDDFRQMQYDNVSLPGRQLRDLLAGVPGMDPALAPLVELMAGWDGRMSRESPAAALFSLWLRELQDDFFRRHVPESLLDDVARRSGTGLMIEQLGQPAPFWFGDDPLAGRNRLIRDSFARAVQRARQQLGNEPRRWEWGALHHVRLDHPMSGLGEAYRRVFSIGPVPTGDGPFTLSQARYAPNFRREHGPTYRHVLDLADWDRGLATSAPGQSGQPESPHYADLLPLWQKAEYFPLTFSRTKVEQVASHRLLLKPAE